jgi:hypothetical protein
MHSITKNSSRIDKNVGYDNKLISNTSTLNWWYNYMEESYRKDCTKIKKGKAVPLEAWSGPEGSRKLRFPEF